MVKVSENFVLFQVVDEVFADNVAKKGTGYRGE